MIRKTDTSIGASIDHTKGPVIPKLQMVQQSLPALLFAASLNQSSVLQPINLPTLRISMTIFGHIKRNTPRFIQPHTERDLLCPQGHLVAVLYVH